jgi:hypothetical protein
MVAIIAWMRMDSPTLLPLPDGKATVRRYGVTISTPLCVLPFMDPDMVAVLVDPTA